MARVTSADNVRGVSTQEIFLKTSCFCSAKLWIDKVYVTSSIMGPIVFITMLGERAKGAQSVIQHSRQSKVPHSAMWRSHTGRPHQRHCTDIQRPTTAHEKVLLGPHLDHA